MKINLTVTAPNPPEPNILIFMPFPPDPYCHASLNLIQFDQRKKRFLMSRTLIVAVVLIIFGMAVVCAEAIEAEQTRSEFERLAAELPYLSISSVIYDRSHDHFQAADPKEIEEHLRVVGKVTDGTHTKEALLPSESWRCKSPNLGCSGSL